MVNTKPLLKTFGAGANVFGQIATDKAVNARRQAFPSFDIADGELVEDVEVPGLALVPHTLGRVPAGALVLKASGLGEILCVETSESDVTMASNGTHTVTIWIV